MRQLWYNLINRGVHENGSNRLNEHIKSVNFTTLVWTPVLLLLSTLCFQDSNYNYGILALLTVFFMWLILALNKNRNLIISTSTFLLAVNFVILTVNVMLDFKFGVYLFIFPLFASAIYLFPLPKHKINLAITLTIMVTLHLSSFLIIYETPTNLLESKPQVLNTILIYSAAFILTFIIVIKYSITQANQRNELDYIIKENEKQNVLLEETLKDKDILLSEIHHRTKNNLAIVSSVLNLQRSQIDDEQLDNILLDCSNRVHSIAAVHQKLYEKGDFSVVNFKDYMSGLITDLQRTLFPKDKEIKLITEIEPFDIKTDQAVSCALILNEVITNSVKYAFNEEDKNHYIDIRVSKISNQIVLMIHDNGPGFNVDELKNNKSSLGMSLIEALTEQLEGNYEYHNVGGTTFTLSFKLN